MRRDCLTSTKFASCSSFPEAAAAHDPRSRRHRACELHVRCRVPGQRMWPDGPFCYVYKSHCDREDADLDVAVEAMVFLGRCLCCQEHPAGQGGFGMGMDGAANRARNVPVLGHERLARGKPALQGGQKVKDALERSSLLDRAGNMTYIMVINGGSYADRNCRSQGEIC